MKRFLSSIPSAASTSKAAPVAVPASLPAALAAPTDFTSSPARRISHALRGLQRRLRPAARNISVLPGYTSTTIDPSPIPRRSPPAHGIVAPVPASAHRFAGLERQAHHLTDKLYPPLPAGPHAAPEVQRSLASPRAFASAVEALFTSPGPRPTAAPDLHRLLERLTGAAYAQPSLSDATRYSGVLQCARALATTTGGDAAAACAALEHLQARFSLEDGADGMPATRAQQHAWSAAKLLAHTASGFDALLALRPALAQVDARPDDHVTALMKRESLRTFLQAASHLAAGVPASEVPRTPAAQLEHAVLRMVAASDRGTVRDSLALNALLCAAKVHAAPHVTAEAIGDRAQIAAYVAWRSGYREGGKGSPLARTQGRIHKFATWARRAEYRAKHRLATFDPRRLLGMQKSPLTATVYGTGGANLSLLQREAQALYDAVQQGIDAVLSHNTALRQGRGGAALPAEQQGLLLLREQVLKHWKARIGPAWQSGALRVTDADKRAIAASVRAAASQAGVDAGAVLAYREFRKLDRLDLKTLARWQEEAVAFDPDAASSQTLRLARTKLDEARTIERGRPIQPHGATLADFRKTLTDAIDTMPLGNNVRYFDGGTYGVNANMSVNQHAFSHNALVPALSLGPGAKALHGRHAFVEIGSSSYGGEVFIGTDKRTSTGAGIGAFGGIAFGTESAHMSVGVGGGVAYSRDRSAPVGVIIRTGLSYGADGKPTDAWRQHASDVVRLLFQNATVAQAAHTVRPERMWEQFAMRFFRTPDISVNWRDQRRSSHTLSANAAATFRVTGGSVHVGPSLAASYDKLLAGKNDRIDANGWLHGVERARARSAGLNVSASLVSAASAVGHSSSHSGHPDSASLPSVPLIGAASTLFPSGASMTLRRVQEHGRLNPRFIRRLAEFVNPGAFLSHLQARRPQLARTPASGARVDGFIAAVDAMANRGNLAFGESWKIRPEVTDLLNAYADEMLHILTCARHTGATTPGQPVGGAQAYQHIVEHIFADLEAHATAAPGAQSDAFRQVLAGLREQDAAQILQLANESVRFLKAAESWKVSGYYVYEINTRGYTAGPSLLLHATAATSTAGERVLAELAVSELEALDDPASATHGHADGGVH